MKNKFEIDELKAGFRKAERRIPILVAREVENHFKQNFRKKAFDKKPWASRKQADRGSLMNRTGRLKRSIQTIGTPSFDRLQVGSNLDYAKVHNEGQGNMPKRQFIGQSKELDKKVVKIIEQELEKAIK